MTNFEQPNQQSTEQTNDTTPQIGDVVHVDERTGRNIVRTLGHSAAVHSSFEPEEPHNVIVPYLAN